MGKQLSILHAWATLRLNSVLANNIKECAIKRMHLPSAHVLKEVVRLCAWRHWDTLILRFASGLIARRSCADR